MQAWRINRRLISLGFPELKHVPHAKTGWDATLACLAYAARMDIEGRTPDLSAWAARHCVSASGRYVELGERALVLWHGTSRARAEKIAEHGLFHKKGVWTAMHPGIPHRFCMMRAERFGDEGAVVCIVLDRDAIVEGRDYEVENRSIIRFQRGLPPEVVEYVLVNDEIRFTGRDRARRPAPWPTAAFKRSDGRWVPRQKPPVRYTAGSTYSTPREFLAVCLARLLRELGDVSAMEVLSSVYAAARPRDAFTHEAILDTLAEETLPRPGRGKLRLFGAAAE